MDKRIRQLEREGNYYEAEIQRFRLVQPLVVWTSTIGRMLMEQPRPRIPQPYGIDERDLTWQAYFLSKFPNGHLPDQERLPGRWDSARTAISNETTLSVALRHGKLSEDKYASNNELHLVEVGAAIAADDGRALVVLSHLQGAASLTERRIAVSCFREGTLATPTGHGRPCELWDKRIKVKRRKVKAEVALVKRFEILWEHAQVLDVTKRVKQEQEAQSG